VNFLDAWTTLDPVTLARWLAPAACVALSLFLPGRGVARLAALALVVALPLSPAHGSAPLTLGWSALWLAVAWMAGRPGGAGEPRSERRAALGGLESGVVGLSLGLALLVIMMAAVARADLGAESDRRVALALLTLGFGLMHLMLRRRVRRATLSFAALGLGLQMLEDAARIVQGPVGRDGHAAVLGATALAVVLADRLATARTRTAGSDHIALAHDLHD
jgi:hypothetical protein